MCQGLVYFFYSFFSDFLSGTLQKKFLFQKCFVLFSSISGDDWVKESVFMTVSDPRQMCVVSGQAWGGCNYNNMVITSTSLLLIIDQEDCQDANSIITMLLCHYCTRTLYTETIWHWAGGQ